MFTSDIIICGGGPAGLAAAIVAARRGFSTCLLERAPSPPDKACGEGLMPGGVRVLTALGATQYLTPADYASFSGIRYLQEDGRTIEARFRAGNGLGIRRTALTNVLTRAALDAGAQLQFNCKVIDFSVAKEAVRVATDQGQLCGQLLIAADGLSSPLRKLAGINAELTTPRRFGMRRHFAIAPWSDFVEVHWSDGIEAYVTPAGADRVGIAFLWSDARARQVLQQSISFERLLNQFPLLKKQLGDVPPDSSVQGAGPLARQVSQRVKDRFLLIGDAAGYLDAITGEGLSLSFTAANILGELLPQILANQAKSAALADYERAFLPIYQRYYWTTNALLFFSRHPKLRRNFIRLLAGWPGSFELLLAQANRLTGNHELLPQR